MAKRANARTEIALADELGSLLARARRRVFFSAAHRLEEAGISIFPWQVLHHVGRRGGASQRELAEDTAQHPAGMCRSLEELEREGLVIRDRDPADRRKFRVQLTAAGKAFLDEHRSKVIAGFAAALSPLDRAEKIQLRSLLTKIAFAP